MRRAVVRTVHVVDLRLRAPQRATEAPTARIPRVAQLLALAHRVDRAIAAGELRDLAHAAEVLGVTRARVTQVAGLLLLAPEIQDEILAVPPLVGGREHATERRLRPLVFEPDWERQLDLWRKLDVRDLLPGQDGTRVLRAYGGRRKPGSWRG